jgi:hypothetical protein
LFSYPLLNVIAKTITKTITQLHLISQGVKNNCPCKNGRKVMEICGGREEAGATSQGRNGANAFLEAHGRGLESLADEGSVTGIQTAGPIDSGDRSWVNPVTEFFGGVLSQMRDDARAHLVRLEASMDEARQRVQYFDELIQGLDDDAAHEAE